jgi:hypothetical protein
MTFTTDIQFASFLRSAIADGRTLTDAELEAVSAWTDGIPDLDLAPGLSVTRKTVDTLEIRTRDRGVVIATVEMTPAAAIAEFGLK